VRERTRESRPRAGGAAAAPRHPWDEVYVVLEGTLEVFDGQSLAAGQGRRVRDRAREPGPRLPQRQPRLPHSPAELPALVTAVYRAAEGQLPLPSRNVLVAAGQDVCLPSRW
jgi:hypothetical protein